ncbi:hypothetical protein [Agrotis ipsilon virus]|nr:hypothetical protein [Agrotis ipsilon virus]
MEKYRSKIHETHVIKVNTAIYHRKRLRDMPKLVSSEETKSLIYSPFNTSPVSSGLRARPLTSSNPLLILFILTIAIPSSSPSRNFTLIMNSKSNVSINIYHHIFMLDEGYKVETDQMNMLCEFSRASGVVPLCCLTTQFTENKTGKKVPDYMTTKTMYRMLMDKITTFSRNCSSLNDLNHGIGLPDWRVCNRILCTMSKRVKLVSMLNHPYCNHPCKDPGLTKLRFVMDVGH